MRTRIEREMLPLSAATPIWPDLGADDNGRLRSPPPTPRPRVCRRPVQVDCRVCRYSLRGAPPGGLALYGGAPLCAVLRRDEHSA